jgi:hypothetical protein
MFFTKVEGTKSMYDFLVEHQIRCSWLSNKSNPSWLKNDKWVSTPVDSRMRTWDMDNKLPSMNCLGFVMLFLAWVIIE